MKTATLVGYHGKKNFGDDIFREIILNWLGSVCSVNRCYLTADKDMVASVISGVSVRPFNSPIKRISRLLWPMIFLKSLKSDYLVFAAGSIFTILPFFLVFQTIWILKFLRGKTLNIIAIGVSIGPFKSEFDRHWCLKTLKLMDRIIVRDLKSKKIIDAANIGIRYELSYDLALCWNKMFAEPKYKRTAGLIGLSLTSRGYGVCTSDTHSHNCNAIFDAIDLILKKNVNVSLRLFCVCSDLIDGDIKICNHIYNRLSEWGDRIEIVIYNGNDLDLFLSKIYECSLMIASRMHAGIMAMTASIPLYQISYAEKISNFFEHCELSTQYLYDHDKVTSQSIIEFLRQGMMNDLEVLASEQNKSLIKKGADIYTELQRIG